MGLKFYSNILLFGESQTEKECRFQKNRRKLRRHFHSTYNFYEISHLIRVSDSYILSNSSPPLPPILSFHCYIPPSPEITKNRSRETIGKTAGKCPTLLCHLLSSLLSSPSRYGGGGFLSLEKNGRMSPLFKNSLTISFCRRDYLPRCHCSSRPQNNEMQSALRKRKKKWTLNLLAGVLVCSWVLSSELPVITTDDTRETLIIICRGCVVYLTLSRG